MLLTLQRWLAPKQAVNCFIEGTGEVFVNTRAEASQQAARFVPVCSFVQQLFNAPAHGVAIDMYDSNIAFLNGLKRSAKSSKDDNRAFLLQLVSPTLGSAAEQIYTGEIERFRNILAVNALLQYPGAQFATDKFYGDVDVFTTPEFHKLEELDRQYRSGEREIKAGNLAQCDPNWNVIDYLTAIMEAETVRTVGDIISSSFKMPEFKLSERTRHR